MPSATPIPLPPLKGASKSKSAGKLAKPVKATPVKKKPSLSEETVIDSSDDDTEEPAPKKTVNGTGAKAPTPSSDSSSEDSESESESSSESSTAAKPVTPAAKKAASSENTQKTPKSAKQARAASPVATIPTEVRDAIRETHSTQELRPAKPFKAPAGYKNASDAARSSNAKLLDRSALSGKQLWYFSAPSTIDLSKLEELTAQQLNGKVPVFKQDDGEYTLQKEPIGTTAEIQIMLPDGQHFAAAPTQILASYKLQHKVTIPSSTAGPTSHHAYAKPKRQQPAGMRTRWRPAGAINSDAEDSDGAVATAHPTQSVAAAQVTSQPEIDSPAPAPTATPTKKRKDREAGESERKKQKKRKKEERKQAEAAETVPDADAMDIDPTSAEQIRFERSTPELIQVRNRLAGVQSQPEPTSTEKKKKKKKDKLREGAEAELPAVVEDSKPKTNGKTPIPLPALPVLPAAEPPAEKKKKKDKDKDKDKGKDKVKVKKEPRVERRTEIVM